MNKEPKTLFFFSGHLRVDASNGRLQGFGLLDDGLRVGSAECLGISALGQYKVVYMN